MKTLGLTDVIGPIMVGPSSSHTAGALRIAYMARRLCLAEPKTVEFRLLGSFAHTLTGHGTDKALVAGMLGLATDDLRIRVDRELSFLRRPVSGERIRERVCRLFLGTLLDEHGLIEVCGLCRRLAAAAGQHSSKQCSGCPAQGFSFHFNTSFLLDASSIAERNGKEFTAVLPFSYVFASGSTMCAVVPLPGVLSSASVPPWTTAISRTSASPRPKPPFFLLREGSPV